MNTQRRALLLAILAAFVIGDVLSTNMGLARGAAYELNPVMAWSQTEFGDLWWVPKLLLVPLWFWGLVRVRQKWLLPAMVALYVAVVVNNVAWTLVR